MAKLDKRHDVDCEVAARLRERRKSLGMRQPDLAAQIGVTLQQISKYESARNRITCGRLAQLAAALGVEPGYFFSQ